METALRQIKIRRNLENRSEGNHELALPVQYLDCVGVCIAVFPDYSFSRIFSTHPDYNSRCSSNCDKYSWNLFSYCLPALSYLQSLSPRGYVLAGVIFRVYRVLFWSSYLSPTPAKTSILTATHQGIVANSLFPADLDTRLIRGPVA